MTERSSGLRDVVAAGERFAAAIEARAATWLSELNLTMPQLRAMLALRQRGRANGRQLATILGLTPGAIVAIGDQLEKRGYVRRIADRDDRRITWFALTDTGAARLESRRTVATAKAGLRSSLDGLTACERAGFVKAATAFANALDTLFCETEVRNDVEPLPR